MPMPEKAYERLQCLLKRWQMPPEDVYYAVENGWLRVCVWIPLRCMERLIKEGALVHVRHEQREGGFIGIRPEDFRSIYSTGCARLRIFRSIRQESHILRMADEPPQPDIMVHMHDLVVLQEDRSKFEASYAMPTLSAGQQVKKTAQKAFSASDDYRHIIMHGEEFHLGDVQAQVVKQLHEAMRCGQHWIHGKTLIANTHSSHAQRLRDIFKSKSDWNKIIASNGHGYYRLNIDEQDTSGRIAA
jgi:hypothetical protein